MKGDLGSSDAIGVSIVCLMDWYCHQERSGFELGLPIRWYGLATFARMRPGIPGPLIINSLITNPMVVA